VILVLFLYLSFSNLVTYSLWPTACEQGAGLWRELLHASMTRNVIEHQKAKRDEALRYHSYKTSNTNDDHHHHHHQQQQHEAEALHVMMIHVHTASRCTRPTAGCGYGQRVDIHYCYLSQPHIICSSGRSVSRLSCLAIFNQ